MLHVGSSAPANQGLFCIGTERGGWLLRRTTHGARHAQMTMGDSIGEGLVLYMHVGAAAAVVDAAIGNVTVLLHMPTSLMGLMLDGGVEGDFSPSLSSIHARAQRAAA
jgi:hypothetical protein